VAAGEGAQREQGRRQWAGDRAGDQGGRGCHQGGGWQVPQLLAQLGRGGDQQRLERIDGLGAGPDRGRAGHPQRADHLHLPGSGLRGHGGLAGLDRAGGGLGIGRVGLAAAAAGLAVGSVDLHHDLAVGGQEAGQGGAVGAGAFHAPGDGLAEPAGPGEQVLIAGGRGGDAAGADAAAELVVGVGDVAVQVGVDPTVIGWAAVAWAMLVMAVSSR
jgi:hypothetical protein